MSFKTNNLVLKTGNIFFKLGIFLLPSAFFFSIIFLLISLIIANIKNTNILKDKWNIPFILCSLVMIIVCYVSNFNLGNFYNLSLEKELNWIGLLNWIPMFWIYWSSQYYLKDSEGRKSCAFFLVLGTIIILISGFGQYFFEWYGPIKFLNGTVIWYQRATDTRIQSLTGPFNNANYAGTWLAVIFPLCLFFFSQSLKIRFNKIFFGLLSIATILATFLTHSRNAILNIFLGLSLLVGLSLKSIFVIASIITFLFFSIFIFEIPLDFMNLFKDNKFFSSFVPASNKISDFLNFTRIKIWKTAILHIFKNPLIGWGASSFSIIYLLNNGKPTFQHTHNIILEVSYNYGIFVSLILFTTIFLLFYKLKDTLTTKNSDEDLINKFWWVSAFIILIMNLVDITYYDGRISIIFWILIAGLRCILREKNLRDTKIKNINI